MTSFMNAPLCYTLVLSKKSKKYIQSKISPIAVVVVALGEPCLIKSIRLEQVKSDRFKRSHPTPLEKRILTIFFKTMLCFYRT